MARRAPWKRQLEIGFDAEKARPIGVKRKPHTRVVREQNLKALLAHPKAIELAETERICRITSKQVTNSNQTELWAYVSNHPREVAAILNKATKHDLIALNGNVSEINAIEKLRETIANRGITKISPAEAIRLVARKIAIGKFKSAKDNYMPFFHKQFKQYLTDSRRIPLGLNNPLKAPSETMPNDEPYSNMFKHFAENTVPEYIANRVFPVSIYESTFIATLKQERLIVNNFSHMANTALKAAFRKRVVPKEILKREKSRIIHEAREIIRKSNEEQLLFLKNGLAEGTKLSEKAMREIKSHFEAEIVKKIDPFIETITERAKNLAEKYPLRKNTTEKQNFIKAHPQNEIEARIETHKKRTARQAMARALGVAYDPFPEIVASIKQKNPARAQVLEKLVAEKHIDPHTFAVLHTKTRKGEALFFHAVFDNEFQKRFGVTALEPLARILSYLGRGKGHINEKVEKNAVRFAEHTTPHKKYSIGHKLMEYLKTHHYLDQSHTGNHVSYLDSAVLKTTKK
ncbi:MAG: hypothetical protein WCI04_03875 [archaeon]